MRLDLVFGTLAVIFVPDILTRQGLRTENDVVASQRTCFFKHTDAVQLIGLSLWPFSGSGDGQYVTFRHVGLDGGKSSGVSVVEIVVATTGPGPLQDGF